MIFSSPLFFFGFLPLCILGFALAGRFGRVPAIGFLGLASLVFYAQWNPKFLYILCGSILFNFAISRLIGRTVGQEPLQSFWLILGIVVNLGGLVYFKYLFPLMDFFAQSGWLHHQWGHVALPLGISFFTFTQIAYLVDLKQGVAECESFLSYVLFVTFFPHLIAGPIIHHKEMMPQFRQKRRYRLNAADVSLGITWFTMGLFKKVAVADRLSLVADPFFLAPGSAGLLASWEGALAYAMQLYFDFSGYSDMAVGIARMFSIRFPLNFNSPYKATSIIEFWQRWHMTFTHYIMNYLYSPIQMWISRRRIEKGKKISKRAQATFEGFTNMVALPTLFTMFLAGVWHGAGFHYFLYGIIHGVYITTNHFWRLFVPADGRLRKLISGPVAAAFTFVFVLWGEIMFRAATVKDAVSVYSGMLGLHGRGLRMLGDSTQMLLLLACLLVVWLMPNTQEILGEEQKEDDTNWSLVRVGRWQPNFVWLAITLIAFTYSVKLSTEKSVFLYFQF